MDFCYVKFIIYRKIIFPFLLEICIRIRSKYDTPVTNYTYEPGQEPVKITTPVAEAEVVFVIPNTAK